jgi:hypothetical protein
VAGSRSFEHNGWHVALRPPHASRFAWWLSATARVESAAPAGTPDRASERQCWGFARLRWRLVRPAIVGLGGKTGASAESGCYSGSLFAWLIMT